MKKLLLTFIVMLGMSNLIAQHSVTLKVINNQDGALTNNPDDNNETNVFCWAGNDTGALFDGDWWYPMYAGETGRTGGDLIKQNGVWIWQCTFDNVAPGDYRWNPHMKTLGWNPIHNLYNYGESADLYFSVSADGNITGQVTLELPLNATDTYGVAEDAIRVYTRGKIVIVENVLEGEDILVFNLSGKLIERIQNASNHEEITINIPGIYCVKSKNSISKVFIK